MSLLKLKAAPFLLIEDDYKKNIVPLLTELIPNHKDTRTIFYTFEQPVSQWKEVFKDNINIVFLDEFDSKLLDQCTISKTFVVINSVNQMVLSLGWKFTLEIIQRIKNNANILQLILVLHKDCLSQSLKLQPQLNHLANGIISYDIEESSKVTITLKKSGKVTRTLENLIYDEVTKVLKSKQILNENKKVEKDTNQILPSNLTTFKIEIEEAEKLERDKLVLPYMSKIHDGTSKVYYEPDAVDDWDDEDPDDDLDI